MNRWTWTAVAALALVSCDGRKVPSAVDTRALISGFLPKPPWAGTYTIRADTVRNCVEGFQYHCTCSTPGYLTGLLTLAGTDSNPSGQLIYQK
ncbi:MAG: hypothetical protein ACREMQ_19390, partial [Longimicrobiales bacterium]